MPTCTRVALSLFLVLASGLAWPAAAQEIGVLQSAETVDEGVFKIMVAPSIAVGEGDADNQVGIGARFGYGFVDRFDAEGKVSFYENNTFVGADAEVWVLRDAGLDFSLGGGVHWMFGDEALDTMGFELTPIASVHAGEILEIYGALDVSFESVRDAPPGIDDSFTKLHAVPGIEVRLSDEADLVGEFGIGLNDDSAEYGAVGLTFYLR
jgi:hypothetical protein